MAAPAHAIFGSGAKDKVKLVDVNAITLHAGEYTTYRRTSAVPQLKCIGGAARSRAGEIETVQCKNEGSDGVDVQWKCTADLSDNYRFGKVEVLCEGYDYPEDPYVLKGSCGLEYTLEYTEKGRSSSNSYASQNSYQHGAYDYHEDNHRGSGFKIGSVIMFALVAYIFWNVYKQCVTASGAGSAARGGGGGAGFYPGGGPGGPGSGGGGGFGPGCNTVPDSSARAGSWTPGFWSGLAAGGLLTNLFGGQRHRPGLFGGGGLGGMFGRPSYGGPAFAGSRGVGGPSFGGGGGGGSSRSASGFGGTRRR